MAINAPSLANIPLTEFGEQLAQLYEGGIRFFHLDIMDGHYVKNLCLPVSAVRDIKEKYPDVTVEVHMMVDNPLEYVEQLERYGAGYAAFHSDSTSFVRRTLTTLKSAAIQAGVALNPSQRIDSIEPYAEMLDYCIFMSVEPGFAGQSFMPGAQKRLAELSKFRKEHGYRFQILVDGGVTNEIAEECVKNGADILVTGIFVTFKQECGIVEACKRFEERMRSVRPEI